MLKVRLEVQSIPSMPTLRSCFPQTSARNSKKFAIYSQSLLSLQGLTQRVINGVCTPPFISTAHCSTQQLMKLRTLAFRSLTGRHVRTRVLRNRDPNLSPELVRLLRSTTLRPFTLQDSLQWDLLVATLTSGPTARSRERLIVWAKTEAHSKELAFNCQLLLCSQHQRLQLPKNVGARVRLRREKSLSFLD